MERTLLETRVSYTSERLTIAQIDKLRPAAKLPVRIAIAPPTGRDSLWSEAEIAELESWEKPLHDEGIAKDVMILRDALVTPCAEWSDECRLEQVRAAALRARADAVVLIRLATAKDEHANPKSLLYLTVVSMWLAEGSDRNALTIAEGVMLDTRNDYFYVFARGKGEVKTAKPLMYADSAPVVAASRLEALRELGKTFVAQLKYWRVAQ
jgi:hypothetical protein